MEHKEVEATLHELAEWFDNPNKCPAVVFDATHFITGKFTAGFLLRFIAQQLVEEERLRKERGQGNTGRDSGCRGCKGNK